jgi:hypothetical protein
VAAEPAPQAVIQKGDHALVVLVRPGSQLAAAQDGAGVALPVSGQRRQRGRRGDRAAVLALVCTRLYFLVVFFAV